MVMSWRGTTAGETAALTGHDVVMSPMSHCYFDFNYKQISTERVYFYEPIPASLPVDKTHHVLGVQANFWSQNDHTPDRTDYQIYPRLLSLAERAWSPQDVRDWQDFHGRLNEHRSRLSALGVKFNVEEK